MGKIKALMRLFSQMPAHLTRREGPHVGRIIIAITIGSTILVIMLSFTLFILKKRKGTRAELFTFLLDKHGTHILHI